jgi:hypothetical protein
MPYRPHNAPITESYRTALRILAADGHILARRVYPRPYSLVLVTYDAERGYRERNDDVPQITLEKLLEDGYAVGEALDPRRDAVRFTITPAVRRGWQLDAPPVDPAQLAFFADAVPVVHTSMEPAA